MPIVGVVRSLIQADSGLILAGTGGNFGKIYTSGDNGLTWNEGVALGDATTIVSALTKDRSGNIFAAVYGSTNPNFNGVWRGKNNGNLWSKVKSHPLGYGYEDITAIQGFRIVAVGIFTSSSSPSPITISNDAGDTWIDVPQDKYNLTYNSVSAAPESGTVVAYPNDSVVVSPAFYGTEQKYTQTGRVGYVMSTPSSPLHFEAVNMAVDPMGNEGLDMVAFLTHDGIGFRERALWAVTGLAVTTDTEIWAFPASPTGPYKFVKVATIPNERFNVLYVDPTPAAAQGVSQRTIWAGANSSKIFVSFNNGLTWALVTDAPTQPVRSFVRTASGVMIAGGQNGEIYRFTGTGSAGGGGGGGGGTPTNPPAPVNLAPIAYTQSVPAVSGVPKAITLTGSDPEGHALTYTVFPASTTHGTLSGTAPNLTYTSAPGFVGTDFILFQVHDGFQNSTAVNITITVAAAPIPNTPPVANGQSVSVQQGVAKAITLSASDANGNPLTYIITANPTHGVLTGTGVNRTYTPTGSYIGNDSFTFKANDGSADSNIATVNIFITPSADTTPVTTAFLGRTETTENAVYVSNKMAFSNVTHIFHYDGAAYTNLQFSQDPPYSFLGTTLAVGKMAYFGSQTNNVDVPSGTFASLVFQISQVLENATLIWEYWNGSAWTTLVVYDNSDSFKLIGARSVHWHPPATWAVTTVNAIPGYWVRVRVSALAALPQAPIQDERYIYTVLLPYVEVAENRVGGDLPAIARVQWHNRADDPTSTIAMEADRLVCGLRTLSRGQNFQSYLNVSDVQPPFGVAVASGVGSAWSTVKATPTNRALTVAYSSAPNLNVWNDLVTFTLSNTVAREYYGSFRVFIRCFKSTGSANVWQVRVRTTFGSGGGSSNSKVVFPSQVADWEVLDLGQISIPVTQVSQQAGNLGDQLNISIQGYCTALSSSLALYDLILIPVDEWAIDSKPPLVAVTMLSQIKSTNFLDMDSITNPKSLLTVLNRNAANQIVSRYQALNNGPAILQSGRQQRLWFLVMATTGAYWYGYPSLAGTVRVFKQQRYLALRGES